MELNDYDRAIAESWLERHYYPIYPAFHAEQSRFIRSARAWTSATVIELGGKNGWQSEVILDHGGKSALIVEGRQSNIDAAKPKHPRKMRYLCADVRKLPDVGEFDAGLVFGLLYHLDDPVTFIAGLSRYVMHDLLFWTHTAGDKSASLHGYQGALWSDSGNGELMAIEPLQAFWFHVDELRRCLEDNGWRVVTLQQHISPMQPSLDAYLIHCVRSDTCHS